MSRTPMHTLSEAEASEKWCPFTVERHHQVQQVLNPAAGVRPEYSNCLGSGCMAWRRSGERGYCGLVGQTFDDPPAQRAPMKLVPVKLGCGHILMIKGGRIGDPYLCPACEQRTEIKEVTVTV